MNYLSNKEAYLRAFTFFQENHAMNPMFGIGAKIKPIESELYVNKAITVGGGKLPLLIGSTDNEIGVTNFDGNKLEEGRAFAIDGIAVNLTVSDASAKPYNVDFTKTLTGPQLAAFQFANLNLSQKNERLISLPISAILNGQEGSYKKYRELALTLLKPKDKVEIEIEFPDGVTPAALEDGKSIFVSVVFRGYETFQKR